MKDFIGREINYLRISVTDRCNYRCVYCMPEEGIQCISMKEVLTFEEIKAICEEAAALGITRLKISGGEPLVRKGVPNLVGMLHSIDGIEQVTMTTNGVLLEENLDQLVMNGLDAVNISIDTLNSERYKEITRGGSVCDAIGGMKAALSTDMKVKVNAVLYPGDDWKSVIDLARDYGVDVRFIETMPIGEGGAYQGASKEDVLLYLEQRFGHVELDATIRGNGPAVYYKVDGLQGRIGLITPIHGVFCSSCNRIRLTASGMIKPCLCYEDAYDIKTPLRAGNLDAVREVLVRAIGSKPQAHSFLTRELVTERKRMSEIGG